MFCSSVFLSVSLGNPDSRIVFKRFVLFVKKRKKVSIRIESEGFEYDSRNLTKRTGGRLTEINLIEIVFFQLIESFIIIWPNFFRLFTWSKNSIKWKNLSVLIWHLIRSSNNGYFAFKKFWSTAKICKLFFGSWSKVLIMIF